MRTIFAQTKALKNLSSEAASSSHNLFLYFFPFLVEDYLIKWSFYSRAVYAFSELIIMWTWWFSGFFSPPLVIYSNEKMSHQIISLLSKDMGHNNNGARKWIRFAHLFLDTEPTTFCWGGSISSATAHFLPGPSSGAMIYIVEWPGPGRAS